MTLLEEGALVCTRVWASSTTCQRAATATTTTPPPMSVKKGPKKGHQAIPQRGHGAWPA